MKAVCLQAPRQVVLAELPEPSPGPEEVLVEIAYNGLCGSDLNAYRGTFPLMSYPRILGHEASGTIVARGRGVPETLRDGTRVMLSPYTACGICPACRVGRPNCCQFNRTLGLQRDGVLGELAAVHYSQVYSSSSLSLRALALVEPLSVGYHAANRGRISETDHVLVIGCGAVGIGAIAAARRKGATVTAIDVDQEKLNLATRFGASHSINSAQTDVLAAAQQLTAGEGFSVALEAVGLPETMRLAVESVAFGGRVVFVGYAKLEASFDTTLFVRKELDILGSRNSLRTFHAVIQMLEQSEYPFEELISHLYPLALTAQALQDWDANPARFAKVMIDVQA